MLIVSPEHNRSIPAAVKNVIDAASRPFGQSVWNGKKSGRRYRLARRLRRHQQRPAPAPKPAVAGRGCADCPRSFPRPRP
ncbi:NAD(P)H-dependent oxidoreductase [Neisseria sp. 23W00296]|uniref:NAD(P)H-dependent oxidoreductase n=1 Tax=unclassified Neisseria TaxID=2623750 RepID=UPI001E37F93B|nr:MULTISPECIES: NAD(P)H-dependent oxidoreductase [unclassified Neisseria]